MYNIDEDAAHIYVYGSYSSSLLKRILLNFETYRRTYCRNARLFNRLFYAFSNINSTIFKTASDTFVIGEKERERGTFHN